MNAFTEMRRRYFDSKSEESFAEYYLAHRCYVSEEDDAARYQLRNKIAFIRSLASHDAVGEAELLGMLHEIGENRFLDRRNLGRGHKSRAAPAWKGSYCAAVKFWRNTTLWRLISGLSNPR